MIALRASDLFNRWLIGNQLKLRMESGRGRWAADEQRWLIKIEMKLDLKFVSVGSWTDDSDAFGVMRFARPFRNEQIQSNRVNVKWNEQKSKRTGTGDAIREWKRCGGGGSETPAESLSCEGETKTITNNKNRFSASTYLLLNSFRSENGYLALIIIAIVRRFHMFANVSDGALAERNIVALERRTSHTRQLGNTIKSMENQKLWFSPSVRAAGGGVRVRASRSALSLSLPRTRSAALNRI